MTLEKLTKQIFDECAKDGEPVTMAEAAEMAKMEIGAKEISNYVQSDKPREKSKSPKTVVVSDEKKALFAEIWSEIQYNYGENAKIVKENKEIFVQIGNRSFKIDLVEHRKPKEK